MINGFEVEGMQFHNLGWNPENIWQFKNPTIDNAIDDTDTVNPPPPLTDYCYVIINEIENIKEDDNEATA